MRTFFRPLSAGRLLVTSALAVGAMAVIAVPPGGAARGEVFCNGEPADVVLQEGEDYVGDNSSEVVAVQSNLKRGADFSNIIRTKGGDDTICSGFGDDSISGGKGEDDLFGETGDDVLGGRQDEDFLDGGFDQNTKRGLGEEDYCLGGKPAPDTKASHDLATFNCEHVVSAFVPVKKR